MGSPTHRSHAPLGHDTITRLVGPAVSPSWPGPPLPSNPATRQQWWATVPAQHFPFIHLVGCLAGPASLAIADNFVPAIGSRPLLLPGTRGQRSPSMPEQARRQTAQIAHDLLSLLEQVVLLRSLLYCWRARPKPQQFWLHLRPESADCADVNTVLVGPLGENDHCLSRCECQRPFVCGRRGMAGATGLVPRKICVVHSVLRSSGI
jgi:hypothetical protein